MPDRTCSVATCGRPSLARTWCATHYERWRSTGDVQPDVPLPGDVPVVDLPGERWLGIPGADGYEVSDLGRVRSVDRVVPRGRTPMHCRAVILAVHHDPKGYPRVNIRMNGKRGAKLLHQLVLAAFVGPCPPGMEGCHENGHSGDPRLANLRWDTPSSNAQDKLRHGTHPPSNRTECPYGHALAAPNLTAWFAAKGRRNCLACSRARAARQRAERVGATFDFQAVADRYFEQVMAAVA